MTTTDYGPTTSEAGGLGEYCGRPLSGPECFWGEAMILQMFGNRNWKCAMPRLARSPFILGMQIMEVSNQSLWMPACKNPASEQYADRDFAMSFRIAEGQGS